ncbi:hypothetical protein [Marisediminicola sp. LYQ134]|uniref:hypothetical protein n=1 Tax=Marisediminicola sp. LYQ134 TaxID=3391061 RepID=UPI003983C63A
MTGHRESPAATTRRRRVPIVAAALITAATLSPIVPLVLSSLGRQGTIGLWFVTPAVLCAIGGVAALLDRSVERGTRIGWAVVAVSLGVVVVPVWWFLLVLLLGP